MVRILIIIVALSIPGQVFAQKFEVSAHLGPYLTATNGVHDIDGVVIDARGNSNEELMIGVSSAYNFNKTFGALMEINLFESYSDLSIKDYEEDCLFCPVDKRYLVKSTKLDMFIGPTLSVNLIKNIDTKFFIGPNAFINLNEYQLFTSFNGRHERTAEVMNALNYSQTSDIAMSYGGTIAYKRFFITMKYTPAIKVLDKIHVFNSFYELNTRLDILQVKIGYTVLQVD